MKITPNSHKIPKRIEIYQEDSPIYKEPLTKLQESWNKLSERGYSDGKILSGGKNDEFIRRADASNNLEKAGSPTHHKSGGHAPSSDKEFVDSLLNAKVEIEIALVNYELIRRKILTLKVRNNANNKNNSTNSGANSGNDNLSFRGYCIKECKEILEHNVGVFKRAMQEQREKRRVLKLFSSFKIKVENQRILVKLSENKNVDITKKLKKFKSGNNMTNDGVNEGNGSNNNESVDNDNNESSNMDSFNYVLETLNISNKIVIVCEYDNFKFIIRKELKDLKEIRRVIEIENRSIKRGRLRISVESEEEYKKRTKNKECSNFTNSWGNEEGCDKEECNAMGHINDLICNFLYSALIHNTEPTTIVKKTFLLLSYYIALRFFNDNKFVKVEYEKDNVLILFFILNRNKLRIEIKDYEEMCVFYNEGAVLI